MRLERFGTEPLDLSGLSADERARIGEHWASRAGAELTSGVVFANIGVALLAQSTTPGVAFLTARAYSDEVRHAEVCRRVAMRYAGKELPFPTPRPVQKPTPSPGQARLAATLHLVLNCCFNEAVAMVFLRTCLDQAENALVGLALRELMREEVDHSRVGWAHLSSAAVSDAERMAVSRALPGFIDTTRTLWLADTGHHVPRGHGALDPPDLARVVEEALDDLILPGLQHCGVTLST
jgi:hypothetical protein